MSNNNGYSGAHLMLAFLAGAVSGACVALLGAPQAGQETRESLRGWASDTQGNARRASTALRDAYSRATAAAKEAFVEALKADATAVEAASEQSGTDEAEA